MMLVLYASELAACVGMNKYRSVDDARPCVWKRWYPSSFRVASERGLLVQKTSAEMVTSLGTSVCSLVSAAVSSGTEKAATDIVDTAMKEKANADTRKVVDAILAAKLDKQKITDACKTLVGAQMVANTLNEKLTEGCGAADVKRLIDSVLIQDVKEAKESVMSEVNKRRGTKNEHHGIELYEKSKCVKLHDKNSMFYKKCIGETSVGTKVFVGGRVDGLLEDRVVEVKCRRNRLFDTLPLYEKVQTQAYLFLTDKPIVEVVQRHDGATRSEEYVTDAEFWHEVCEAALKFASELESLAHTT